MTLYSGLHVHTLSGGRSRHVYHEIEFSRHLSVFNIIPLLLSSIILMRQRRQYGIIMWRSLYNTGYLAPVD